jgi:hypothetical protein
MRQEKFILAALQVLSASDYHQGLNATDLERSRREALPEEPSVPNDLLACENIRTETCKNAGAGEPSNCGAKGLPAEWSSNLPSVCGKIQPKQGIGMGQCRGAFMTNLSNKAEIEQQRLYFVQLGPLLALRVPLD